tara:strand:+ start:778 stop:999 length:222 start_codon:yes stop_codon:yes gene_type:complete
MNKILYKLSKIWDRIAPTPISYAIMQDSKDRWYVVMLRGQFKHRVGPFFKNKVDVFSFYNAVTTTEEVVFNDK